MKTCFPVAECSLSLAKILIFADMAKGLRATIMHELRLRGKSNCKSACTGRCAKKACSEAKQGFFIMQTRLVYNASKPCFESSRIRCRPKRTKKPIMHCLAASMIGFSMYLKSRSLHQKLIINPKRTPFLWMPGP